MITIEDLSDGEAIAAINAEIERAIENIRDPNTEADKERSVTVTIKLRPDSEREMVTCIVATKSVLAAAAKPIKTRLVVTHDDAAEWVSPQMTIDERLSGENVRPIKGGAR